MIRKVVVIEVDVTEANDSTWTIALQMATLESRSAIEKQVIVKRSSTDRLTCIPEVRSDNFVVRVTEETRDVP